MPKTFIADIRDNRFPPIVIEPGSFVVWRNLDPEVHSAETRLDEPRYFTAGPMAPGETSPPVLFGHEGSVDYVCRFHTGMTGRIDVRRGGGAGGGDGGHHGGGNHGGGDHSGGDHGGDGGHGSHLLHTHGFVTGGRSASRLYMTHTPVLHDERHNYQVILQGGFVDPEHARIYEELRAGPYGHGLVQIFHEHVSMPDLGRGILKNLPECAVSFYPNAGGEDVPGLESNVPVAIDRVIHFHQFDTDAERPDSLTYLLYGDEDDAFIDHHMDRAPSFHSVARLARAPAGWSGAGEAAALRIPAKRVRDLEPRLMPRWASVDEQFYLYWLLPPGPLPGHARDPLTPRGGARAVYAAELEGVGATDIEIDRFLHFDLRLINYGPLILPPRQLHAFAAGAKLGAKGRAVWGPDSAALALDSSG